MFNFLKVISLIHSVLGGPLLQIIASLQLGMEVVILWHCQCFIEALIVAFSSSVFLVFLLTMDFQCASGQWTWLANHKRLQNNVC